MIAVCQVRSVQGACECPLAAKSCLSARSLETQVNYSLSTFQFTAFHISSGFENV